MKFTANLAVYISKSKSFVVILQNEPSGDRQITSVWSSKYDTDRTGR